MFFCSKVKFSLLWGRKRNLWSEYFSFSSFWKKKKKDKKNKVINPDTNSLVIFSICLLFFINSWPNCFSPALYIQFISFWDLVWYGMFILIIYVELFKERINKNSLTFIKNYWWGSYLSILLKLTFAINCSGIKILMHSHHHLRQQQWWFWSSDPKKKVGSMIWEK